MGGSIVGFLAVHNKQSADVNILDFALEIRKMVFVRLAKLV